MNENIVILAGMVSSGIKEIGDRVEFYVRTLDKRSGVEHPNHHRVVARHYTAQIASTLRRGTKVVIKGKLRSYDYNTEIHAQLITTTPERKHADVDTERRAEITNR